MGTRQPRRPQGWTTHLAPFSGAPINGNEELAARRERALKTGRDIRGCGANVYGVEGALLAQLGICMQQNLICGCSESDNEKHEDKGGTEVCSAQLDILFCMRFSACARDAANGRTCNVRGPRRARQRVRLLDAVRVSACA